MYGDKIKLCYMDTDSFIIYVETEDFYKDIINDVNKWFDTSNYSKDINRELEKGKNKKFIGKRFICMTHTNKNIDLLLYDCI